MRGTTVVLLMIILKVYRDGLEFCSCRTIHSPQQHLHEFNRSLTTVVTHWPQRQACASVPLTQYNSTGLQRCKRNGPFIMLMFYVNTRAHLGVISDGRLCNGATNTLLWSGEWERGRGGAVPLQQGSPITFIRGQIFPWPDGRGTWTLL